MQVSQLWSQPLPDSPSSRGIMDIQLGTDALLAPTIHLWLTFLQPWCTLAMWQQHYPHLHYPHHHIYASFTADDMLEWTRDTFPHYTRPLAAVLARALGFNFVKVGGTGVSLLDAITACYMRPVDGKSVLQWLQECEAAGKFICHDYQVAVSYCKA